jgi:hypothetical protein
MDDPDHKDRDTAVESVSVSESVWGIDPVREGTAQWVVARVDTAPAVSAQEDIGLGAVVPEGTR